MAPGWQCWGTRLSFFAVYKKSWYGRRPSYTFVHIPKERKKFYLKWTAGRYLSCSSWARSQARSEARWRYGLQAVYLLFGILCLPLEDGHRKNKNINKNNVDTYVCMYAYYNILCTSIIYESSISAVLLLLLFNRPQGSLASYLRFLPTFPGGCSVHITS